MIAGNISGAGDVAVGAAGAVPVINKSTKAWIGNEAIVTALGAGAGSTIDTALSPWNRRSALQPGRSHRRRRNHQSRCRHDPEERLHYSDGFTEGEAVRLRQRRRRKHRQPALRRIIRRSRRKRRKSNQVRQQQMRNKHRRQLGRENQRTRRAGLLRGPRQGTGR